MYMNYDKMMETNDGTQILQTHAIHGTDTYPEIIFKGVYVSDCE